MASNDEVKKIGGDEMSVVVVKDQNHAPLPLSISTSHREVMSDENGHNGNKIQHLADVTVRDEISQTVPSSSTRLRIQRSKEWMRNNPVNMVVFLIWIISVFVSSTLLIMVMTGLLNHYLPKKSQRDAWIEVNNQILTALFTLLCLYLHPTRIRLLALLLRWKPQDAVKLRKIYCKNGTRKSNDRAHMMVVVILLNLNCCAQYAICGLYWGYRRSNRPAVGLAICVYVAIGTALYAVVYAKLSPLREDCDKEAQCTDDEEAQVQVAAPGDRSRTRGGGVIIPDNGGEIEIRILGKRGAAAPVTPLTLPNGACANR